MSSKVRVYEVAKQLSLDPKAVVALFQAVGINDVRNHMSSVEPEQIERVKRHLEKQKTHDVVEERVRNDGRVIKRRSIAKPAGESAARLPTPPASSRADVAGPASAAASSPDLGAIEQNGHAVHADRESVPAPAASVRDLAPASVPADRKSTKNIVAAAASSPALPVERKSTKNVVAAAASSPALPVEEPPPPPPPVVEAAPEPEPMPLKSDAPLGCAPFVCAALA